jgi:hypothetical protein
MTLMIFRTFSFLSPFQGHVMTLVMCQVVEQVGLPVLRSDLVFCFYRSKIPDAEQIICEVVDAHWNGSDVGTSSNCSRNIAVDKPEVVKFQFVGKIHFTDINNVSKAEHHFSMSVNGVRTSYDIDGG